MIKERTEKENKFSVIFADLIKSSNMTPTCVLRHTKEQEQFRSCSNKINNEIHKFNNRRNFKSR